MFTDSRLTAVPWPLHWFGCSSRAGAVAIPDSSGPATQQTNRTRERPLAVPAGLADPNRRRHQGRLGSGHRLAIDRGARVLTADGRVVSYGTKADGTQTGLFIYDIWNPSDDSHMTLVNGSGTDIFAVRR